MSEPKFLRPEWPAPRWVKAVLTQRQGGVSLPPFEGFNLATHVGDDPAAVLENRLLLQNCLQLPNSPCWLDQQHTTDTLYLQTTTHVSASQTADASWTDHPDVVSVVMTADCLPILVTNKQGTLVSAIHAGWKGLADGVVENAITRLPEFCGNLLVWIGPAIGANAFEVGQDVVDAFCLKRPELSRYFVAKTTRPGYFLADLVGITKVILAQLGVTKVYGGQWCTFELAKDFYSYRRDGQTGRMASLIWIDSQSIEN